MYINICKYRFLILLIVYCFFKIVCFFYSTTSCSATISADDQNNHIYSSVADYKLPESIVFCGESVPIENRHIYEMLEREFIISLWDRAQTLLWFKRSGKYFPHIEKKLTEVLLNVGKKFAISFA